MNKNIVIFSIILAIIIIILLIVLLRSNGNHNNNNNNNSSSCLNKKGFDAATKILNSLNGKIIIDTPQFKTIKESVDNNIDQALLCIANAIAYKGTTLDKTGQRIPRYEPPPSAAHTVISGYPVGACVLGESGKVYLGANFEFFAPLSNTVHGEQCAIFNAAVNKEKSIVKLAVNAAPCGHCRQYLVEIGDPDKLDVIFCSNKGNFISNKLSEIIPENFGPMNLGIKTNVFNSPAIGNNIGTVTGVSTDAKINTTGAKLAEQMCREAYAPYSLKPVGISLEFKDNSLVGGKSIENAAYNPTVTAVRGTFALASLMGKDFTQLKTVNICELDIGEHTCPPPTVSLKSSDNESPKKQNWYSNCVGTDNELDLLVKSMNVNITTNKTKLTLPKAKLSNLTMLSPSQQIVRLPL
jgi:cytidine deaminase